MREKKPVNCWKMFGKMKLFNLEIMFVTFFNLGFSLNENIAKKKKVNMKLNCLSECPNIDTFQISSSLFAFFEENSVIFFANIQIFTHCFSDCWSSLSNSWVYMNLRNNCLYFEKYFVRNLIWTHYFFPVDVCFLNSL